jgi:manganese/zinc/iron transport system permease protein
MFLNSFNPYHGQFFWSFLLLFMQRMGQLFTGRLRFDQLASDEIQVFVLMGVALSSAFVGTFLVLRRMTMLANSLSHTILVGIVIAYFVSVLSSGQREHGTMPSMQILIGASLFMGFLTAFLTEFLTKKGKLQEDASTGLVFTSLFALGVILVTVLTRDSHIGTEAVMGNADALHYKDLFWVYVIVSINIFIFTLFFKEFTLSTFDIGLTKALGFSPLFFNYVLMAQVSATTITSFRAVGVLLVLAFMTGPPLAARLIMNRLSTTLLCAGLFGIFCALVGVAFTRHMLSAYGIALSTAGVVSCTILFCYLAVICGKWIKSMRLPTSEY